MKPSYTTTRTDMMRMEERWDVQQKKICWNELEKCKQKQIRRMLHAFVNMKNDTAKVEKKQKEKERKKLKRKFCVHKR